MICNGIIKNNVDFFLLPKRTQNIPPIIGIGIVAKNAPNFPKDPKTTINNAPAWTTCRLPT